MSSPPPVESMAQLKSPLNVVSTIQKRIAHSSSPEPAPKSVDKEPLTILHLPESGNGSFHHKQRRHNNNKRGRGGFVSTYFIPCLGYIFLMWIAFNVVIIKTGPNTDKVLRRVVGQVTGLYHIASPDSFSACIYVKDDNHRLVEWIAYHYHTFNLEYLIVGYDKSSETSPAKLLKRWTKKLTTELWDEDVFIPPEKRMDLRKIKRHRKQVLFYKQCIRRLKEEGRTYTLFVDADEFVTFRYPPRSTTPNSALLKEDLRNLLIPSVQTKGAIHTFLKQEAAKGGSLANPCITIPRLRFIGKETSYTDPMNMDTLRFSAHGQRNNWKHNGLAKNIIDVSRVDLNSVELIQSPNGMIKSICWNPQLKMIDSLFQVNHYLGSWESASARQNQDSEFVGGRIEVRCMYNMDCFDFCVCTELLCHAIDRALRAHTFSLYYTFALFSITIF